MLLLFSSLIGCDDFQFQFLVQAEAHDKMIEIYGADYDKNQMIKYSDEMIVGPLSSNVVEMWVKDDVGDFNLNINGIGMNRGDLLDDESLKEVIVNIDEERFEGLPVVYEVEKSEKGQIEFDVEIAKSGVWGERVLKSFVLKVDWLDEEEFNQLKE